MSLATFVPDSGAMLDLLNDIIARTGTREPPSDEELTLLLYAQELGVDVDEPSHLWSWPEETRAGFFGELEERCDARG